MGLDSPVWMRGGIPDPQNWRHVGWLPCALCVRYRRQVSFRKRCLSSMTGYRHRYLFLYRRDLRAIFAELAGAAIQAAVRLAVVLAGAVKNFIISSVFRTCPKT